MLVNSFHKRRQHHRQNGAGRPGKKAKSSKPGSMAPRERDLRTGVEGPFHHIVAKRPLLGPMSRRGGPRRLQERGDPHACDATASRPACKSATLNRQPGRAVEFERHPAAAHLGMTPVVGRRSTSSRTRLTARRRRRRRCPVRSRYEWDRPGRVLACCEGPVSDRVTYQQRLRFSPRDRHLAVACAGAAATCFGDHRQLIEGVRHRMRSNRTTGGPQVLMRADAPRPPSRRQRRRQPGLP
jgi:hypothetical protein